MKSVTFIHNDDAKCFHMVVQGTHKLVMIGCINFEDHVLIKRQRVDEKMNVRAGCSRIRKNRVIIESNLCLLLEVMCIFEVLEFTTI